MAASFNRSDDLKGATFTGTDLTGARFVEVDFVDIVMRGSEVRDVEIESPWLFEGGATLHVNGVDVVPLVDAELNRRFPGRELRRAGDPEQLRAAWEALQSSWAGTLERVATLPPATVDESVGGEWSFAQTLRHLVFATDVWLRKAIQGVAPPYHPLGQTDAGAAASGIDMSAFVTTTPPFADVLAVRAERVEMVRDFLAATTAEELAEPRTNPWASHHQETVLSCLHTILEEEWEHHRYAVRDLDVIASTPVT